MEDARVIQWEGARWVIAAACGSLKVLCCASPSPPLTYSQCPLLSPLARPISRPRVRHPSPCICPWLLMQGGRSDWLVEKSCELGAAAFQPLLTERSDSMGGKRGSSGSSKGPKSDGGGREARLEVSICTCYRTSMCLKGDVFLPFTTEPHCVCESDGC